SGVCVLFVLLCFFFSSRRRHTRFSRDWSSDVCSSDLISVYCYVEFHDFRSCFEGSGGNHGIRHSSKRKSGLALGRRARRVAGLRSEERRVGKEGSARGSPAPYYKSESACTGTTARSGR